MLRPVVSPVPWFDRPWGRRVVVSALLSMIVASAIMMVVLWRVERMRSMQSAERFIHAARDGGELPTLWPAPSFALTDQHGREVTLAALRGRPFVADFIFTQCTSACPMITSRMVMLQRSLAGQDVHFVSFSVDPAHDTPDVLAAYATRWNDRETRWTLLATTDSSLQAVASGFRIAIEKTLDDRNPILHSSLFFLVDGEGQVRGVYPSDASDSMARLEADVRRLSPAGLAADGASPEAARSLYAALGCPGCHENAKVAPPLVNLHGALRMLQDGSKVTIDDAYLRRAILDPGAEVVADYPALMPSYRHALSDAQVDALVAELDARTVADASAPPASVAVVVDPVCRMKVRATADAPHVSFRGQEIYFCSETCRDEFAKHPDRFSSEPLAGTGNADR